ncbi:MAG: hypoxanthine phosphoribosyltransferase [Oscillospiraceae bacterium]|nr:hypoxanthine phosphoribosyltransferase [Oscillospiraceae bacterium]
MKNLVEFEKKTADVLYNESQIAEAVRRVGAEITRDYAGKNPLFIGILKGSFMFMADLVRRVELPCEVDFMVAKSYGDSKESSGIVQIVKDIGADIFERDVIIVEDILDTGRTLCSIREVLQTRSPSSIKICVFLDKKTARKSPVTADYVCFEVADEFVVGYGLDYAEKYRNLPDLRSLN